MDARLFALAIPLALGAACSHRGQTGAMSRPPAEQRQATGGGTGGEALAEDPIMRPGPSIKGHAEDLIVSGRIADASDTQVIIETPLGDRRTLQIAPETTVELDGMEGSWADLAEGQPVRASYAEVEGEEIAVHIRAGDRSAGMSEPGTSGTGAASEPGMSGTGPGTGPGTSGTGPSSPDLGTGSSSEPAAPAPAPDPETAPDAGWGPPPSGNAPSGGQR